MGLYKHGHSPRSGDTAEYRIWTGILTRCTNPNATAFPKYGGRGIGICARWRESFVSFFADVGPRPSAKHSIDRFPNNDGNYEPGNVRWATMREQCLNRRSNHRVTIGDETHPLTVWLERYGTSVSAYKKRRKMGWGEVDAITRPFVKYSERRFGHAARAAAIVLAPTMPSGSSPASA